MNEHWVHVPGTEYIVDLRAWTLSAADRMAADLEHKMFGPNEEPGMWKGFNKKEKDVAEKLKVTTSTTHNLDVEGDFFTLRGNQYALTLRTKREPSGYLTRPEFDLKTVAELDELEKLVAQAREHFTAQRETVTQRRCSRCGFWDSPRDSCGCNR